MKSDDIAQAFWMLGRYQKALDRSATALEIRITSSYRVVSRKSVRSALVRRDLDSICWAVRRPGEVARDSPVVRNTTERRRGLRLGLIMGGLLLIMGGLLRSPEPGFSQGNDSKGGGRYPQDGDGVHEGSHRAQGEDPLPEKGGG
jgi:hypothetical protein